MREINIEVFDDKKVKINNPNLGDKGDNEITRINFIFDKFSFSDKLIYNYFSYRLRNSEEYHLKDITESKSIILDYEFMKNSGTYDCLFILSDKELQGYFTNDKTSFVSDLFYLYINNNYLTKDNLEIKENKEGL